MTEYRTTPTSRKRKKRKGGLRRILLIAIFSFALLVGGKWVIGNLIPALNMNKLENATVPDWVKVQIIEVNGTSRRGVQQDAVKDIVIHYVGNPGSTAQQNRDYYNKPDSEVSSHFIIGLDGEVIQCVPLNEKSSASNGRNGDTISIEVCHPDKTGQFTEASYNSLLRLTAWLNELCNLDEGHIIRHYDITGKKCPLYFVQHEDKWEQFRADVAKYHEINNGIK